MYRVNEIREETPKRPFRMPWREISAVIFLMGVAAVVSFGFAAWILNAHTGLTPDWTCWGAVIGFGVAAFGGAMELVRRMLSE